MEAEERWGGPERHVWVGKFIRTLERKLKGPGLLVGVWGQGWVLKVREGSDRSFAGRGRSAEEE